MLRVRTGFEVAMASRNYYEVLEVDRKADDDAVKNAYRKLAWQYHPDRNPGDAEAEARFKELSEAFDVLKDKDKRAAYDLSQRIPSYDINFFKVNEPLALGTIDRVLTSGDVFFAALHPQPTGGIQVSFYLKDDENAQALINAMESFSEGLVIARDALSASLNEHFFREDERLGRMAGRRLLDAEERKRYRQQQFDELPREERMATKVVSFTVSPTGEGAGVAIGTRHSNVHRLIEHIDNHHNNLFAWHQGEVKTLGDGGDKAPSTVEPEAHRATPYHLSMSCLAAGVRAPLLKRTDGFRGYLNKLLKDSVSWQLIKIPNTNLQYPAFDTDALPPVEGILKIPRKTDLDFYKYAFAFVLNAPVARTSTFQLLDPHTGVAKKNGKMGAFTDPQDCQKLRDLGILPDEIAQEAAFAPPMPVTRKRPNNRWFGRGGGAGPTL